MASEKKHWTLVQHTGFSVDHKEEFEHAVELRAISEKQAAMVKAMGGCVFETYAEAHETERAENYPPGVKGIIPRCTGKFLKMKGKSERLYIPKGGGK